MEVIERLELKIRNYLRLRKIFRTLEIFAPLVIILMLLLLGENVIKMIACIGGMFIIFESFLAIRRNNVKTAITDQDLMSRREFELYTWLRDKLGRIKEDFLYRCSENSISEECKQIVMEEEIGIGWLSLQIKKYESRCNEAKQIREQLKPLLRLVIF